MKWLQILIAFDQFINALAGGWADETFSCRCFRNRNKPEWRWRWKLVDRIFFWQKDHCKTSFMAEFERKQLPPEFRTNLNGN